MTAPYDPTSIPNYYFMDAKLPAHYKSALSTIERHKRLGEMVAAVGVAGPDKQAQCDLATRQYHRWQYDREYQRSVSNRLSWLDYLEAGYTTIRVNLYPEGKTTDGYTHKTYVDAVLVLLRRAHSLGIKILPVFGSADFKVTHPVLEREKICCDWSKLPGGGHGPKEKFGHPVRGINCSWMSQTSLDDLSSWLDFFANRPNVAVITPEIYDKYLAGPEGLVL